MNSKTMMDDMERNVLEAGINLEAGVYLEAGWVRELALQWATDGRLRRSAIFDYLADNAEIRKGLGLTRYKSGGLGDVTELLSLQGRKCLCGAGLLTVSYPKMTFHVRERAEAGGFTVDCGGVSRQLFLSPESLCVLLNFIDSAAPRIESKAELESRRWSTEQLILAVTLQQRLAAKGLKCRVDITAYHLWVKTRLNDSAVAEYRLACSMPAIASFLQDLDPILSATHLLESRFGDWVRVVR